MRIDSPNVSNLTFQAGAEVGDSQFTGSFTGSFTGIGTFTNIEDGADVTDTTNVTAAGALMDSEVTNLAEVKAFDSSDYATAAQGTTADAALPKTGGAMTGAITTNSTFDGRDVATDGTKLDGIEASADVTDTDNVKTALNASLGGAASIGDSSDTITIPGNLTVTGTKTELQVTNLNVEDLNITVASGSADSAAADGAGLTVDGADATFTYSHSGTQWNMNKKLDLGSNDFHAQDAEIDSLGIGTPASGTTGEIRATGDITAFYSSDERLKENFAPLTGALDKVKAIGGYEFDWKDGIEEVVSKTGHDIGVKAQELQAQYPELVHERDNGYLAVDYIKLNAVLIEAVKELAAKVDELSK